MYDFMEYCLRCFYRSTGWNEENQYSNLCSWSRALLDFYTPHGLSLDLAKLPTPQFKPAYTMNALPSLNGSIGYLYTHQPLNIGTSATVDFKDLIDRFRVVHAAPTPDTDPVNNYLLYGRLFFPGARLEAMYVRRLTPHLQYLVTAVNHPRSPALPQVAMQLQYDVRKWCSECSYTTDDGLFGMRALYNFANDSLNGQWALGTELYYGTLDKSGGLSMGLRYRTSPICSPPICFTYTLNPLVGHMSTAYVAQVTEELVMCSRFDFSIYSYESDLALGFEYQAKNKGDNPEKTEKLEGLIKARIGFAEGLAVMWEGRYKKTLFSLGLTADLSSRTSPIRTIGIEMQYFS
ncbi:mitochondrial distribution and morphology protein 10 [Syncephalastrum racemosum]|uniref:Mitochondrial distribution and morphology protein 10 n=1 Tax=Syncephalastrum racemosum TaxID=13706 RepID=A0A1X2H4M8_SYNRA|nr:mitochondrial distribution and morphology protein 10 [Syncephalastrum racemosum]